jgi:hypothetical protein
MNSHSFLSASPTNITNNTSLSIGKATTTLFLDVDSLHTTYLNALFDFPQLTQLKEILDDLKLKVGEINQIILKQANHESHNKIKKLIQNIFIRLNEIFTWKNLAIRHHETLHNLYQTINNELLKFAESLQELPQCVSQSTSKATLFANIKNQEDKTIINNPEIINLSPTQTNNKQLFSTFKPNVEENEVSQAMSLAFTFESNQS